MEHGPFEDVFPIENGDVPASYVSLPEGMWCKNITIYHLPKNIAPASNSAPRFYRLSFRVGFKSNMCRNRLVPSMKLT